MKDYKKIEDYGIIGDLDTCALVGKDGSIDWCCLPHIESPSVFAGVLDIDKGGHFAVHPSDNFDSEQRYIERTNVLQTVFKTSTGTVILTDFMPVIAEENTEKQLRKGIYRKIVCDKGFMGLKVDFKPRFDYVRTQTIIKPTERGVIAIGNNEQAFLDSPFKLQIRDAEAFGRHPVKEGDIVWLVMQYGEHVPVDPEASEKRLKDTSEYWVNWAHSCEIEQCVFGFEWHELIARSGLVLKLLTHKETGAIYAASTTSLPEEIGGIRNWDYRFAWIRDASFTVQALYNVGHIREAKDYLKWVMEICKSEDPSKIQIMYGLHGELDLKEMELDHLSGYRNSRPVRIGNAAAKQRQLDIYGELINAIYEIINYERAISENLWQFVKNIVDYVCQAWNTKDAGIWEVRSEPQHFVYSKLMCWVALDRGIKMAEKMKLEVPLDRWEKIRDEIKSAILQKGFSQKMNSFVQYFNSKTLDATSLLIPIMGLLPFDDRRIQGTIDATLKRLTNKEGFVYRYEGEDGLPGKEGAFLLCSFWLVDALSLSGRVEEAENIFTNILKYASPLGLFAEEIDPDTGEQRGNFPQAFSHIGLINSALYLGKARGRKQRGPEPLGFREKL